MAERNDSQRHSIARTQTQVPSTQSGPRLLPAATKAGRLIGSLERLCSAKATVQLTSHQAETWLASLSVFDPKIVNAVILKIAHGPDPFPDLGKIVIACEQLRRERAGTPAQGEVKIGAATLKALADAWGLDV
jgi:hypothetical protein